MAASLPLAASRPQAACAAAQARRTPSMPAIHRPRVLAVSVGRYAQRKELATLPRAAMLESSPADSTFASLMDDEYEEDEYHDVSDVVKLAANEVVDESLLVENLGLCQETVNALKKQGINSLFAIQKAVFQPGMEGRDLIGRAKTGSGKTLAFALPVVEELIKEQKLTKPERGRGPRCIVLAPTRELANQVSKEFEWLCPSLKVCSFYGGTSIVNQIRDLERGVDIVVGTPGRVIDLIERRSLRLEKVRFAILDEADQMLDMGFEEDMEKILGYAPEERQTFLFSATMPTWVHKVAKRFQRNPLMVDLVGSKDTGRIADTIRLLLMQVEHSQKMNALLDACAMFGSGGKTIVFVNTKAMADQICDSINKAMPCVVLHGDIAQAQRDRGLQLFRSGKFQVLVATDVAARGLDIPSVDLVAHYDVPLDAESFLHRSGRTGRAGKTGTALVLFTDRETRAVGQILKATKTEKAEMVGAADPAEVMTTASRNVLSSLDKVSNSVIDFFVPAAERLLASEQPARVLAAALASMSGFSQAPKPRSLLTYEQGMMTLRLMGDGKGSGAVDGWNSLNQVIKAICKKAKIEKQLEFSIGKIKILEDQDGQDGAAFDLPCADAEALLAAAQHATSLGYTLDKAQTISVDVQEMLVGGRGGPPRADRGSRSWGARGGSDRGGWGNRGNSASGSWGDRGSSGSRGGGGGYSRGGERSGGYGGSERSGGYGGSERSGGYSRGGERSGGYGGSERSGGYGGSERSGGYGGSERSGGYSSGGRTERIGGAGRGAATSSPRSTGDADDYFEPKFKAAPRTERSSSSSGDRKGGRGGKDGGFSDNWGNW